MIISTKKELLNNYQYIELNIEVRKKHKYVNSKANTKRNKYTTG